MTDSTEGVHGDDILLVTEIMQQILKRLEPLDGVDHIASRRDFHGMAKAISDSTFTFSDQQAERFYQFAETGSLRGAKIAGREQAARIEAIAQQIQGNVNYALGQATRASELAEEQASLISRWKWWGLGLSALCGLFMGGLVVAFLLVRDDAHKFHNGIQSPIYAEATCSAARGTVTPGTREGKICWFKLPD